MIQESSGYDPCFPRKRSWFESQLGDNLLFLFSFFFFAFVVFIFIFFFLFFIFNRIDNPPTSAFRYKFPKDSKYFVLFTEIQPFLEFTLTIMQTSPCNEYPLTPHFYMVRLGFTGVYIFFLFLLYNIDRGYSLGSNVYQRSMF